jgi:hypothetical protein
VTGTNHIYRIYILQKKAIPVTGCGSP